MPVMTSDKTAAVTSNATFVRPEYFYLDGFSEVPHMQYLGACLCFIYIFTVLGNVFLLSVIYQVRSLHTPKYMIVCNLAFVDMCESTAFIPRVLETLLGSRYILYEACLSNLFFIYFFASLQSWTLVAMAYDRLIAICLPLRYHSLMSMQSLTVILLTIWAIILAILVAIVKCMDRLSFCGSLVHPSLFCTHYWTFNSACNDTTLNLIFHRIASVIFMFVPLIFIAVTYICIGIALIRIASAQERRKAMKTCTAHLILVSIFFLPISISAVISIITKPFPNGSNIYVLFTHVVPALCNPIIFSLKTEEVLDSIKRLYRGKRIFQIIVTRQSKQLSSET